MNETKTCKKCAKSLPLSAENFYRNSQKKDGFENTCKVCKFPPAVQEADDWELKRLVLEERETRMQVYLEKMKAIVASLPEDLARDRETRMAAMEARQRQEP